MLWEIRVTLNSISKWQPVTPVRAESSTHVAVLTPKVNVCDISYLNFQCQTNVLESQLLDGQFCLFVELLREYINWESESPRERPVMALIIMGELYPLFQ